MNLIKGYSDIFWNVVVRIPQNMENVDFLTPNLDFFCQSLTHTAGLDTIFIQIYMDAPPVVPGVSKNQNFF